MNKDGSIDYKKPFGAQHDYRTSSYIAHFERPEPASIRDPRIFKNVCSRFIPTEKEEPRAISEQRRNYIFKPPDPFAVRNPTVGKTHFMKDFETMKLRHPPKPLSEPQTTNFRTHDFKVLPKEITLGEKFKPSAMTPLNPLPINRIKPGYTKYLDPAATTSNTTYIEYAFNDLGIGTKDQITYYNWKKQKCNVHKVYEIICQKEAAAMCPKRRNEFQNQLKAVPNSGQKSEFSDAYGIGPTESLFDLSRIKYKLLQVPTMVIPSETSNSLYGKGKRTESIV